jgi:hypothetical protein
MPGRVTTVTRGQFVKVILGFMAGIMLLVAQTATAQAQNPPFLQGKYTFISSYLCAPNLTVSMESVLLSPDGNGSANAVKDVTPHFFGNLFGVTGYVTFTPTGDGTGGTFVLTGNEIGGGAISVAGQSFGFAQTATSNSGSYSATATTATLNGHTALMTFGSVSSVTGYANTVNLVQQVLNSVDGNGNCVQTIALTRKQFSQ